MKLELIPLAVSDIDTSKAFYADQVGFNVDHDVEPGNGARVVRLTPPGSSCSIAFGNGIGETSIARGLLLVVDDIEEARNELLSRNVEVGEVEDMGGVKFAWFSDPDGHSWGLQEIPVNISL